MKHMAILALACLIVAGCGKSETVAVGPNGETATISKDGNTTTFKDEKGNTTTVTGDDKQFSMKDDKGNSVEFGKGVTEEELGLPFYPGSVEKPNASLSMAGKDGEKNVMAARTTKDDPAKVTAFYKDKIVEPKDASMNTGDSLIATLSGKLKDGADVNVAATKKGSEDTEVMVTVTTKKK